MANRIKYNDELGQHMTPVRIAELVCQAIEAPIGAALDLSAGHGDLLVPLKNRWPDISLHGVDCDPARVQRAALLLGAKNASQGDGLTARVPKRLENSIGRFLAIGNPPFLPTVATERNKRLLARAFVGVDSRHGARRLEMAFLARALLLARARQGLVAIILPSAFSSGLLYTPYRQALLEQYRVLKAIEIRAGGFRDTEASTVLLIIDTAARPSTNVEISSYDVALERLTPVFNGIVKPWQRLDATYWCAAHLHASKSPTLRQVGADIARGSRSHAEAARESQRLFHTTDLSRLSGNRVSLGEIVCNERDVTAEAGDILLPRTGTRVRWEAVEVTAGSAPISDHVLRIRAPRGFRKVVKQSFGHPDFRVWLQSISKGVCATVLTKHELLDMPLFALKVR